MPDRTPPRPSARLALLLLLAVLLAPGVAAVGAQGDAGSATFHGNAGRTGEQPGPNPEGEKPKQLWRFATGDAVRSSPTVADGTVYVGSNDGNLYALEARNGKERWRFTTDGPIRSSAAVADGVVYVGSGDGYVYALDAEGGDLRWKVLTGAAVTAAPAVAGGVVYISGNDYVVRAIDAATGTERWNLVTRAASVTAPSVDGSGVFVGIDSGLVGADIANGRPRWPVTKETRVNEPLDELVKNTGSSNDVLVVAAAPAVLDGVVYVAGAAPIGAPGEVGYVPRGLLVAVEAETGAPTWAFEFAVEGSVLTTPTLSGGRVFVGSDRGMLYGIDAATGEQRWGVQVEVDPTGKPVNLSSSPAVVGEAIYVTTDTGKLFALKTEDGRPHWRQPFATGGTVWSSPAVVDGVVYLGSDDGGVYAVGAA